MKQNEPNGIWPEDLVRYKEILDNNPVYSGLNDEEKVRIADRIMHSTYADLTDNWAFKWVFLNHPDLLIMLLKDILEEDIVGIEYLPTDALAATLTDKQAAMDVTCKTSDGRQFVVEMQTNRKTDFKNRLFYYGASAIHRQVKTGSNKYCYDSVRVIAILNYTTNHGPVKRDKVLFRYEFREVETRELYGIQMRLYMLELPRMKKAVKNLSNLEEWCYMFNNFTKFEGIPKEVNPRFHKLMETIRINNMTDEQKSNYFKSSIDDDERKDIAQANFEYGMEEGKSEASREMAIKLLSEGITLEVIQRVTNLSEAEISKLQ